MTDRKALSEPNETPEDVATLYSWANLHGAKYRDFSASRAQTRENARLRVQEAIEEERRRAHDETEAAKVEEARRAAEAVKAAEAARRSELAAQEAARQAERQAEQSRQQAARQAEMDAQRAAERAAQQAAQQAAHLAAQQELQQHSWQQPRTDRFSQLVATNPVEPKAPTYPVPPVSPQSDFPPFPPSQAYRPAPPPQNPPLREENFVPRAPWAQAEARETAGRPAWLVSDRPEELGQAPRQVPEDTLQGSRERLASRWFALKGVFEDAPPSVEVASAPAGARVPAMAVFSLAGGVGKTSLVATLGRALSSRGERVLLVDTAAYGLLPFFFGARDQRPGVLRTFTPPGSSGDAPLQMVTIDPETLGPETAVQETLTTEIGKLSRGGISRVIVDLATASGATTRRILRLSPLVLVPVIPDMNSVVSVGSIDAFFQHNSTAAGTKVLPYYVLNQFDPSLPLHLDVREVLRQQLGDRLLTFVLRRTPAVSEALAEGMTVMDYAPNSPTAEDFGSLAGWVKSLSAPAATTYRGVRWSER
jgi:cellulose synthase operon protein YhjQ